MSPEARGRTMRVMPEGPRPIEEVLKEAEGRLAFLTPKECGGGWVEVFGEAG